jgi:eukaryotic-like serine/threonine-protein kinase
VHRDIKPGNVMVTRSGQIKVMDFGIARAISDSSATVAQTSVILGTAQYFSPEQAKGETVDFRSDLYSTGVVLFEMLTGRPPFRGDSPIAVAYQHVSERPDVPSSINPALTEPMDAVVLRALAKDKSKRYQSADEFRDDVDAVLAGRPPAARLPTAPIEHELFGGSEPDAATTVRQLAFDDPGPATTSSRPPVGWIWAGILVVFAIVVAVGIWVASLATGGFGADDRTVPDLTGSTRASAERAIRNLGLQPLVLREASSTVDAGLVIRSNPDAAAVIERGDSVRIWVSTGTAQSTVPTLAGLSRADATQAITDAGLVVGTVSTAHSKDQPEGTVLSASRDADTEVDEGSRVDLVVSDGRVDLPDLTGEPIAEAQATLQDLGLTANVVPADSGCSPADDSVFYQATAAGAVAQGSSVTLQQCVAEQTDPTPTESVPAG